jgi:hypothetical protein
VGQQLAAQQAVQQATGQNVAQQLTAQQALQQAAQANVGQQLTAQQAAAQNALGLGGLQAGAQQNLAAATLGTSQEQLAAQGQMAQGAQAQAALAAQAQQAAAANAYTGAGQQITAQGQLVSGANQAAAIQAQAQQAYAAQAQQAAALQQAYAQGNAGAAATLAGQQIAATQAYQNAGMQQVGQQLGYLTAQQQAALQQGTQAANLAVAQGNLDIQQQAQNTAAQQVSNNWTGQLAGAALAAGGAVLASDARMKYGITSAMDSGGDYSDFRISDNRIARDDPYDDQRYTAPPDTGDHIVRENPYGEAPDSSGYNFGKTGKGVMNAGLSLMQPQQAYIPGYSGPVSDERAKEDIHAHSPVMRQLDAFDPKMFHYRDPRLAPNPEAGDAPHMGVIAQDVARGPAGRTLVQTGPNGMLNLNTPAMVGTLAAGEGALKRRTDDHDARLRALERVARRAT